MIQTNAYLIYPIGDQGITLDYGGEMSEKVNQQIFKLYRKLKDWQPAAVLDIIPAYHSISLIYDLIKVKKFAGNLSAYHFLELKLKEIAATISDEQEPFQQRIMHVPVCYDSSLGPDLKELAALHQLSVEALIDIHCKQTYRVYMIGFLPGFAYMGTVDDRIVSPRKASPRINVPAGSVGIAGSQTGIYPFASPGGWQLIGQTPLILFDTNKTPPSLFEPGDEVRFQKISLEEFHHLKNSLS